MPGVETHVRGYWEYIDSVYADVEIDEIIIEAVGVEPVRPLRIRETQRRRPQWSALAAAALALLLIGGVALWARLGVEPQPVIQTPPSTTTPELTTTTDADASPITVVPGQTDKTGTTSAAPTPTGLIAFVSSAPLHDDDQPGIYVVNPDGTGLNQIVETRDVVGDPTWSPDGTSIVFSAVTPQGRPQLFVVNGDGTGLVQLTDRPGGATSPLWSPDGTRIAFQAEGGIELITPDGSDVFSLGAGGEPFSWSPDSSQLVFRGDETEPDVQDIYVINNDGSDLQRLTFDGHALDSYPRWSPDGTLIAYWALDDDSQEIYLINPDGTEQTRLTQHPDPMVLPTWSPDSTRLAIVSFPSGLYIANKDGSSLTKLTDHFLEVPPAWSPDGSYITFSARDSEHRVNLYIVNVETRRVTRLTDNQNTEEEGPGAPVWSPS